MKRFLSCCLFFSLFFCSYSEVITLKIASVAPARSPWDIELKKMAQEWTRITKGQVKLQFYDMTVLGGEKAGIQKLKSTRPGQKAPIDGALFSTVGLHELAPTAGFYTLSVPFLIQNQDELDLVLSKYGSEMEKKVEKAGCKIIAWSNVGWLSFYTKESYKTLAELKKMKMAVSGLDSPILSDSFKVSGFNVVDTPAQKFSQMLKSKNGVDGFFAVHLLTYASGFYKDIHYALDVKLCPVMAAFVISNASWEKIPKKYHAPMKEAMERARQRLNNALDSSDAECIRKMEAGGVTMIRLSKDELKRWEDEFSININDIHRTFPNAFDMEMYKNIQALLAPMRK